MPFGLFKNYSLATLLQLIFTLSFHILIGMVNPIGFQIITPYLNKTSLHQLMGNCLFLAVPYTLVDEEGCERKQPLNVFNDWKALIVGHTSTYSQNHSNSQVG
jgi:hypothetical protein